MVASDCENTQDRCVKCDYPVNHVINQACPECGRRIQASDRILTKRRRESKKFIYKTMLVTVISWPFIMLLILGFIGWYEGNYEPFYGQVRYTDAFVFCGMSSLLLLGTLIWFYFVANRLYFYIIHYNDFTYLLWWLSDAVLGILVLLVIVPNISQLLRSYWFDLSRY